MTVHVLEHQIAGADVVKLADVRVIQRGNCARFLLETAQSIGIGSEGLGKNLDRDLAPQTRVTGPIDFAHPSGAQRADDFKWTESGACGQGHADHSSRCGRRVFIEPVRGPPNRSCWSVSDFLPIRSAVVDPRDRASVTRGIG